MQLTDDHVLGEKVVEEEAGEKRIVEQAHGTKRCEHDDGQSANLKDGTSYVGTKEDGETDEP